MRVARDGDRDFAIDPALVPEAADLVVVGNPASPSGTLAAATAILALRRPGRTVVVDEAFMSLVPGEPGTLVRTPLEDVIVVRSLTKALGIPGLRAGYAVAPPALADRLRAVRPPWSANVLALRALSAAAAHPAELAAIAERADAERTDLAERLAAIAGVRVWPGSRQLRPGRRGRRTGRRGSPPRPDHRRATRRLLPRARRAPHSDHGARPGAERAGGRGPRRGGQGGGVTLTVVGIGADGWAGLGEAARRALRGAPLVVGSQRQLDLLPAEASGTRRAWPQPLEPLVDELAAGLHRDAAVLASGDPMLHGVGATLVSKVGPERVRVLPHPSAFALACARMGWPAADVELVSAVARPSEVVVRALQPGRRIVAYVTGADGAARLARVLCDRGFGASAFTVLAQLDGPREERFDTTAREAVDLACDPLHVVAIAAVGGPARPRTPGLTDDAFETDGQLTKRHVRAVTLAALGPLPGELLWDVGAGSGSIAIEWLRAEHTAGAVAIEPRADRAERIGRNALAAGRPRPARRLPARAGGPARPPHPRRHLHRRRRHRARPARRLLGGPSPRRAAGGQHGHPRGRARGRGRPAGARRRAAPHRYRPRRAGRRLHRLAGADDRRPVVGHQGSLTMVHFIGAGPGAADLLTLRAQRLIAQAPVCLYAGALVPPEVLAHAPAGARLVDTQHLQLEEIVAELVAADAAARRSRGCTRGTCRSTAPRPSRCAASTRSASPGTQPPACRPSRPRPPPCAAS